MNSWRDLDLAQLEFVIRNRSPHPREQVAYQGHLSDEKESVWGAWSYLSTVDDANSVLVLAGSSTAGTDAAAEFLLVDARRILERRDALSPGTSCAITDRRLRPCRP